MISLTTDEKWLLFDHYVGPRCAAQAARVESLLARNEQACDIHAQVQVALGLLKGLRPERCPEELAERTIRLLCAAAAESTSGRDRRGRLFLSP
jgi:hypothetical protein